MKREEKRHERRKKETTLNNNSECSSKRNKRKRKEMVKVREEYGEVNENREIETEEDKHTNNLQR